jgi:hypothetical protein
MVVLVLSLEDRAEYRTQLVHSMHSPQYDQWHDPEKVSNQTSGGAD